MAEEIRSALIDPTGTDGLDCTTQFTAPRGRRSTFSIPPSQSVSYWNGLSTLGETISYARALLLGQDQFSRKGGNCGLQQSILRAEKLVH